MWWLKVASNRNLGSVLNKTYTKRKSEQIQKLIQHSHPDFTGKSDEQLATEISQKEANDPLGARKFFARYSMPARSDAFLDSEYDFITKRNELKIARVKKEYENKEKTFYQAISEVASDNTVIINSIENTLVRSILPDDYNIGIVTSEIMKIGEKIDPKKIKGKHTDIYRKIYKCVNKAFDGFKKYESNELVRRFSDGSLDTIDKINESMDLLQGSLKLEEETQQEIDKPIEGLISSLARINSEQSVNSTHAQRVTDQRRSIFPHLQQQGK